MRQNWQSANSMQNLRQIISKAIEYTFYRDTQLFQFKLTLLSYQTVSVSMYAQIYSQKQIFYEKCYFFYKLSLIITLKQAKKVNFIIQSGKIPSPQKKLRGTFAVISFALCGEEKVFSVLNMIHNSQSKVVTVKCGKNHLQLGTFSFSPTTVNTILKYLVLCVDRQILKSNLFKYIQ